MAEQGQDRLKKFRESGQEAVRLQLALEAYSQAEKLPEPVREEYRRYLKKRRRPAAEALLRQGNLPGLRFLWRDGVLEAKDRAFCLEAAWQAGQTEAAAWLLGQAGSEDEEKGENLERPAQEPTKAVGPWENVLEATESKEAAESKSADMEDCQPAAQQGQAILQAVRTRLQLRFPSLALALGAMPDKPRADLAAVLGTDGCFLYFQPERLLWQYQDDGKETEQTYLHLCLHALYLHMLVERGRKRRLWETACDWTVEYRLEAWTGSLHREPAEWIAGTVHPSDSQGPEWEGSDLRDRWFRQLETLAQPVQEEAAYRWLQEHPEREPELRRLFRRDAHPWQQVPEGERSQPRATGSQETGGEGANLEARLHALKQMQETARRWNHIQGQSGTQAGGHQGRRGALGGSGQETPVLERRKSLDYRQFLKRYAVFREERQLDMENFDYLPYLYSREHYEKLLFLEPLEYAEVHRLEELVIAIDTSGSCSGKVVQRFLEETYQIFSETENFFRRMRVAVIQCDAMIQDCTILHSQEEWEAYGKNLKVQGLGGTDFRPVFRLVEEMRQKKQLRNLKGLLYFTDGDGIYPSQPPPYETAFVFLNDAYEKGQPPEWAVKLNLKLRL